MNLVWHLCNATVLVIVALQRYQLTVQGVCCFCQGNDETETHLFLQCMFAGQVWTASLIDLRGIVRESLADWFMNCVDMLYLDDVQLIVVIL